MRALLVPLPLLLLAGCASSAIVTPPSTSTGQLAALPPTVAGLYRLRANPAAGTAELIPLDRGGQALGDNYSVDITLLAKAAFNFVELNFPTPNLLQLDFQFIHPIPDTANRRDLSAFDVRMHILDSDIGADFSGTAGLMAPVGSNGAPQPLQLGAVPIANADGWSTWGAEVVEPSIGALAPNCYPFKRLSEDTGTDPIDPNSPSGWNVIPQSERPYLVSPTFHLNGGDLIDGVIALEVSYGSSGLRSIANPNPGSRLNPRYFNPEFNLKEAWKVETMVTGAVVAGDALTSVLLDISVYDHQGISGAVGAFDPLTAPQTSLRYTSALESAQVAIPGILDPPMALPAASFSGEGNPSTPYHCLVTFTGDQISVPEGDYLGVVAIRDEMSDVAGSTSPIPTQGYTRDNTVLTRHDFTAYQTFRLTVQDPGVNQVPVAELQVSPDPIDPTESLTMQPGPGTIDPDGTIVLYEYDFEYVGSFTADASSATPTAITSIPMVNLNPTPLPRTVAMRITDDGIPARTAIAATVVDINASPLNEPPQASISITGSPVAAGGTAGVGPGPGTFDPDGSIVLYEYDFDYTGTFVPDASSINALPIVTTAYPSPGPIQGVKMIAMRVTDNATPPLRTVVSGPVTINPPTWTQIYNIIQASDCQSCHNAGFPPDLLGNKNVVYANIVNISSVAGGPCFGMKFVQPFNHLNSHMYRSVDGTSCGAQMPYFQPAWPAVDRQWMGHWIDSGAANN